MAKLQPYSNYPDKDLLSDITVFTNGGNSLIVDNAVDELINALNKIINIKSKMEMLTDLSQFEKVNEGILLKVDPDNGSKLESEGYSIKQNDSKISIVAKTEQGLLYGVFDFIRRIAQGILSGDLILLKTRKQYTYAEPLG